MKNLNQSKINKILVIVLIALVAFIGYSRITEQKRVEYYICYQQIDANMVDGITDAYIKYCKDKAYERND